VKTLAFANRGLRLLILTLSAFVGTAASAQEVAEIPFFNAPPGTAGLGGGIRGGQSPYLASDNEDQRRLDLIPLYLYEGQYLFVRGTAGGVHIVKNDSLEINLLGRYRFQRLDPDSNVFYQGLNERKQSFDAGLEFAYTKDWGELGLSWVTDTLGRHNGQEVQFSYRYIFDLGPWTVSPFIGWSWQDENLTNYYFGVSEAESRPDLPVYVPGESQWLSLGLNTSWQISDRIMLFGNLGFGGTDSVVDNSPLVEEAGASAIFVGGTYVFGNARRPDYIVDEERAGEWAWRVNYGYQADGNIIGEIDHGDFSKSGVADTNIAGLTLSKLLTDGSRVDFLGKVAAFRHYEEDEGNDDFWSYAAYIMVQGKGYSPWSKQELFRYGFGFGMSYAENIPIAEQRKQTGSGTKGNTSHFLNYLELTIDFPLRRASKASWLQNCYAGMTVVHRSGIFGTSDILGDVSGGADWITAHLECTR
jgi:outer membrane scaffolding protein for murein synthesis (MipA/OmpV family)